MKIVSYNVNGIRAAIRKGFDEWMKENQFDIICLQETKAHVDQVDTAFLEEMGYSHNWFSAEKKGYSSVAILSKIEPKNVVYGTGRGMEKYSVAVLIQYINFSTNCQQLLC